MEDYSKENFDELCSYANKILEKIKESADKKNSALEDAKRRFANLRGNVQNMQDILNNTVK